MIAPGPNTLAGASSHIFPVAIPSPKSAPPMMNGIPSRISQRDGIPGSVSVWIVTFAGTSWATVEAMFPPLDDERPAELRRLRGLRGLRAERKYERVVGDPERQLRDPRDVRERPEDDADPCLAGDRRPTEAGDDAGPRAPRRELRRARLREGLREPVRLGRRLRRELGGRVEGDPERVARNLHGSMEQVAERDLRGPLRLADGHRRDLEAEDRHAVHLPRLFPIDV